MQKDILGRKEFYNRIVEVIRQVLGESVLSIILFGSVVYLGRGEDVDLIVVIDRELDIKEKLRLEYEVSQALFWTFRDVVFDVHIMDMSNFEENLVPGTFLSGLALGYEILFDRVNIEEKVLKFLEELSRERYVLHNKYGSWDLSHYARVLLETKKRKEKVNFLAFNRFC